MKNDQNKHRQAAIDIFTATAFCVYTWSIIITLWDISGLLLHLTMWDVIGYVAYQMAFSLAESIIITFFIFSFSLLIPIKLRGTSTSLFGSLLVFSLAIILLTFRALPSIPSWLSGISFLSRHNPIAQFIIFGLWIFMSLVLFLYPFIIHPKERGQIFISNFLGRLHPLVGLYVTVSIVSLLIVIGRNIA